MILRLLFQLAVASPDMGTVSEEQLICVCATRGTPTEQMEEIINKAVIKRGEIRVNEAIKKATERRAKRRHK